MTNSPLAGAMFIVTGSVRYAWQRNTEADMPVSFPYMREEDAVAMMNHCAAVTADEANVANYRDMRIAHVSYSEVPEIPEDANPYTDGYNDTDPLF